MLNQKPEEEPWSPDAAAQKEEVVAESTAKL
jgi:hypothetical protein